MEREAAGNGVKQPEPRGATIRQAIEYSIAWGLFLALLGFVFGLPHLLLGLSMARLLGAVLSWFGIGICTGLAVILWYPPLVDDVRRQAVSATRFSTTQSPEKPRSASVSRTTRIKKNS